MKSINRIKWDHNASHSLLAIFALLGMLTLGATALTGCEQQGPAERAGENIDEAAEDAADAADDAADELEDAADDIADDVNP